MSDLPQTGAIGIGLWVLVHLIRPDGRIDRIKTTIIDLPHDVAGTANQFPSLGKRSLGL